MELNLFKETLLEFLSDVTFISEKAKATFLQSHVDDSWKSNKAPNGYNVLTPFLLVKEVLSTRIPDRPKTIPEEGQEVIEEEIKPEVYVYRVSFKIYTAEHSYHISATWKEYHAHYIGCISNTRTPRPGEDWIRGNDLPDGHFCRETWEHIKNAIIKYEMKGLSKYIVNGRWDNREILQANQVKK